jgi:1-acyl-sn-glycerol-3-phosphate acyltransferase
MRKRSHNEYMNIAIKYMLKPLQWLYSFYALALFVALLLLQMPVFMLASLFGKIRGGNILYRCCGYWADVWLLLVGIRTRVIHEAKWEEERPCVFVANHTSYMDIPMIVKVIREPMRVLGKIEMSKIPLFGFLYRNAVVMVDRSNPHNRATSIAVLKRVLRKGVSIFVFPEGSFNETGRPLKIFYDGAFRIAIETQTPIQPVLFIDTVERLHYRSIFTLTPGISRAVFTDMIDVKGYTLEQLPQLKTLVHQKMEDCLRKYQGLPRR